MARKSVYISEAMQKDYSFWNFQISKGILSPFRRLFEIVGKRETMA